MNVARYPWLQDLNSETAQTAIKAARQKLKETGAVTFPDFLTEEALQSSAADARSQEDGAFTTDDTHTAYLKGKDIANFDKESVYNHSMRTQVASIAYDELPANSQLKKLYENSTLLAFVSSVVEKQLYLSDDPLGCCSINVFRPSYHHSFHFDESEFSTTLMLQDASEPSSGLFEYTRPLRTTVDDLALPLVAAAVKSYDENSKDTIFSDPVVPKPHLEVLDFRPGTLSIFCGSRSLHRVTRVAGNRSRLVAVLTFASEPGFVNSPEVQKLFWGRSIAASNERTMSSG